MKAISGNLNTSTVISFDVIYKPSSSFMPGRMSIKAGSPVFGEFSVISETECSEVKIKYVDLANNIHLKLTESQIYPKSKIYVRLPNPSLYAIPEFFAEGYFKYLEVVDHNNREGVDVAKVSALLDQDKVLTMANRIFIKKVGPPRASSIKIDTEFGKLIRIKKQIEVDI